MGEPNGEPRLLMILALPGLGEASRGTGRRIRPQANPLRPCRRSGPRTWDFGDVGSGIFPPPPSSHRVSLHSSLSALSGRTLKSGSDVVRALRPSTVLVVGDVVAPGGRTLGDGYVGHEVVLGGTMPVVLTVRGDVDVAGADLDDLLAS
jgi:hypothetical protein